MRPILLFTVMLVVAIVSARSARAEANAAIIDGRSIVFVIAAPPGWILDTTSGRPKGLPAVAYPKGDSWPAAKTVMYVNNVETARQPQPDLADFVTRDVAAFLARHPELKVTNGKPLPVGDGRLTVVKEFRGDRFGNYEAVAYIAEDKTISSFTLSAKTEEAYTAALSAFAQFVASYAFLTSDTVE